MNKNQRRTGRVIAPTDTPEFQSKVLRLRVLMETSGRDASIVDDDDVALATLVLSGAPIDESSVDLLIESIEESVSDHIIPIEEKLTITKRGDRALKALKAAARRRAQKLLARGKIQRLLNTKIADDLCVFYKTTDIAEVERLLLEDFTPTSKKPRAQPRAPEATLVERIADVEKRDAPKKRGKQMSNRERERTLARYDRVLSDCKCSQSDGTITCEDARGARRFAARSLPLQILLGVKLTPSSNVSFTQSA